MLKNCAEEQEEYVRLAMAEHVRDYFKGFSGKITQHVLGTYVGPDMII